MFTCILASLVALCFADQNLNPIVKLTTGSVRGRVATLEESGHSVDQFLGIPYAEPPIEELRFAAPEPVKPWNDLRDATNHGSRCPQKELPFPMNVTIGECKFINWCT